MKIEIKQPVDINFPKTEMLYFAVTAGPKNIKETTGDVAAMFNRKADAVKYRAANGGYVYYLYTGENLTMLDKEGDND